jgi:hypothetical protein
VVALIVLGILLLVLGALFTGMHILGVLGFWLIVIGAVGVVLYLLITAYNRTGRRLP